jgi:hypothetical protein
LRINQKTGVVKKRLANRRLKRFTSKSGFLVVNDGVGIAEDLARAIARKNTPRREAPSTQEPPEFLSPKSSESAISKASRTTYSNPEESKDGKGKFRLAWSVVVPRLIRLWRLKKNP